MLHSGPDATQVDSPLQSVSLSVFGLIVLSGFFLFFFFVVVKFKSAKKAFVMPKCADRDID